MNIGVRASAGQLREKLSVFPKLDGAGGYELLHPLLNSRSLAKLQTPQGHTPVSLKRDVGKARMYIRPLQRDLNLSTSPSQVSVTSQEQSNQDSNIMVGVLYGVCVCV